MVQGMLNVLNMLSLLYKESTNQRHQVLEKNKQKNVFMKMHG